MRRAILPAAAIAATVAGAMTLLRGPLEGLERAAWDWRVRFVARPEPPRAEVLLVVVDAGSLEQMEQAGSSWPWPRDAYRAMVTYARQAGARAVFFDMIFSEPSAYSTADDEAFAAAMRQLPTWLDTAPGAEPVEPLRSAAAGLTIARALRDPDGVVRRYELWQIGPAGPTPSIALAAARCLGQPIPEGPPVRIFRSTPGCPFPIVPAARLIAAEARLDHLPADLIRDRVVIVGASAPGLGDVRATSTDPETPGIVIHAQALRSILEGRFVRRAAPWEDALVALVVALAAAVAALVLRPLAATLVVLAAGLLLVATSMAAAAGDLWVGLVPAVGSWAGAVLAATTLAYATEGRRRRLLRRSFEQFLAPAVVDKLVRSGPPALGGERKEITILFMDVLGFTSIAERLEPEILVRQLNLYHSVAVEEIFRQEGTLDKFIGDAVMAFWGDPLPQPDHAVRAARAALSIRERLAALASRHASEGDVALGVAFGIHTGIAVVGNMGSDRHMNYTAIGDAVNLAARLEALNRAFGTTILISDATRARLADALPCRPIARVRVKGRSAAAGVHELGVPSDPDWEAALAALRDGRFQEALARLEARSNDPPARFLADWLRRLGTPPPGWDATWQAESK